MPERTVSHFDLLERIGMPMAVAFLFALLFCVANPFKFFLFTRPEVLAGRNAIAVMCFDNVAEPSDTERTAQMISSLMVTGLSESPHVTVISRQRLLDLLNRLGHPGTKVVSPALATAVGRQAGVRWLLTGSVLRTEPHIVLVSNLSNVKNGTVIASQRVDGADGEDLFAVVDRLCAAVCQDLALPQSTDNRTRSERLADVTTSSPEAYRAFLEGTDFKSELDYELALTSFQRAAQLDTTFAMAYYNLARTQDALGMFDEAKRSLARAVRYLDRTSRCDRLYIKSFQAQVDGDFNQAAAYLEELTAQFPQEKQAFFELGTIYSQQFELDKAIAQMEQALVLDSNFKPDLNNLAYAYQCAGEYEKSISVANRYVAVAPNEPSPYATRGEIQAMNGRMEDAIASYKEALARKPDFYHAIANLGHLYLFKGDYDRADSLYRIFCNSASREQRAMGRKFLACIPLYRGNLEQALTVLDQGLASDETEQVAGFERAEKHELKARICAAQEDYDRALAETGLGQEIRCNISASSCHVARANYIKLLVDSGRWTEASDSLQSFEQQVRDGSESGTAPLSYARGILARAHGDYDLALEQFHAAAKTNDYLPRFELAKTCLAAGHIGEAVSLFQGLAGTWCDARASHILSALDSEYLLGVAYDKSGRKVEAEKQFERYLSLRGTSAPHSPMVADALSRLSRLASAE